MSGYRLEATPALLVVIPLETAPKVFAITNTWEDEKRLLVYLERLRERVSFDEAVERWMQLVRDGWPA